VHDTIEHIKPEWLVTNATVYARLLLRLLTDPQPLPTPRKSDAEVAALIQQDGADEALRWQILLPA
jgi:hypothetical protein